MDEVELELVRIPKLIKIISNLLTEIVKNNATRPYDEKDPFSSKKVSSVTVKFYLERIRKYTKLENSTLIIALISSLTILVISTLIFVPLHVKVKSPAVGTSLIITTKSLPSSL